MEGGIQLVGRAEFKGEGEELHWNVLIVFVCCLQAVLRQKTLLL